MKNLIFHIRKAGQTLSFITTQRQAVIKIFILSIGLQAITWIAPQKVSAQVTVSFQVFYDDLSPYGNWIDNSDYGYVWVPNVTNGFTPYSTNGYWVFTDAGWTWVSNYSWGWAPFHYGRWFYDPYYGWLWVPDTEWGPGWVCWRRSEGYYGWAPIGPGISIDIAYSSGYDIPHNQWTFVRDRDFGRTNIYNYYINSSNNTTIYTHSSVINNIQTDNSRRVRYNGGPARNEVERYAGKKFTPIAIKENNRPGQNLSHGQLQLYRPNVERNVSDTRKPAPTKVKGWKDNQQPRIQPTRLPPEKQPNTQPTRQPNTQPTKQPFTQPTKQPNTQPTKQPFTQPTRQPNTHPTKQPFIQPTRQPNTQPTKQPYIQPTRQPNTQPTKQPYIQPTRQPNTQPTKQPFTQPTRQPNTQPTKQPFIQPTRQPNTQPTRQPITQPVKQLPNIQPTKMEPNTQPAKKKPHDN